MKKKKTTIFKSLKKYRIMIIAIVILIGMQVLGDLYLPNLMSDIINNGVAKIEYSVNEEKLFEALGKGELPQLTGMLAANNITSEMLGNEEVRNSIKDKMLVASTGEDYTELDTEQIAMFQTMLEKGIVETKSAADIPYIIETGIKMILISLVATIVTIIATYLSTKVSVGFGAGIREEIFKKVSSFSSRKYE